MDILLAGLVALAAVVVWSTWEASVAARLRRDTRSLVRRNAAVAGAHRLTVVGQLALVAIAAALAGMVGVPLWWSPIVVADPVVGTVVTALLIAAAAGAAWYAARRGRAPQDRRALAAAVATALATEVVLRGLALSLLDAAGSPVTMSVLLAAVATGLLQAGRAHPGSRAFGFVLATVLGFVLGLVVVLTGSVLAAAAVHVALVAVGLARSIPVATSGCACGGHDHDRGTTTVVPASTGTSGTAVTVSTADGNRPGAAEVVLPGATQAAHARAGQDHASCGSSCDHAGTNACAVCPLSTARV